MTLGRNMLFIQQRNFSINKVRRDIKVKSLMNHRDQELIGDLNNYLTNLMSVGDLRTKIKHFTHPKAFKMYRKHQIEGGGADGVLNSIKIRNHIIYNAMVASKGSTEVFGLSKGDMINKLLESSLKIIDSNSSPLTETDKIHCLYQLSLLSLPFKYRRSLHNCVENTLSS